MSYIRSVYLYVFLRRYLPIILYMHAYNIVNSFYMKNKNAGAINRMEKGMSGLSYVRQ